MRIAAVVLAAGLSSRMGRPKPLLPWRDGETVIEAVVAALASYTAPILVVTGAQHEAIAVRVRPHGALTVFNPDYASGEMLSSLKIGLRALPDDSDGALIALGDQPRLTADAVRAVGEALTRAPGGFAAPSYAMRRGHPMGVARKGWGEFLDLPDGDSPRTVVQRHAADVTYVVWGDDSVISDMDTPQAYADERAKAGLPPIVLE